MFTWRLYGFSLNADMTVLTITVASAVTLSVNLLTITVAFATFSINVLNILICDFLSEILLRTI